MIFRNKRGADKIITIYWFAILMLVAAGVFSMVLSLQSPYDVRELEASILADQIAGYLVPEGVLDSDIVSKLQSGETIGTICQSDKECRQITGNRIMEIVGQMKNELGINNIDEGIRNERVAENLECLMAQIALKEASLRHCENFKNDGGNPFYCEGDKAETRQSSDLDDQGNSKSWGIMQIYKSKHPGAIPENFVDSVEYATKNVLVEEYKTWKDGRIFPSKLLNSGAVVLRDCGVEVSSDDYDGWKAAIRGYNGWGCGGNYNYVEDVVGLKDNIEELFPSQCSSTEGIKISEEANLNIDNGEYYFEVHFTNFTSGASLNYVKEGNLNLEADCKIQEDREYKRSSKCFKRSFYAVDEQNNPYSIKILTVVRKTEKNVAGK